MVTMVDEIFDRMYQEGRADFHRSVGELFRKIGESLNTFHDSQWSAPWAAKASASKDAGCA